MADIKFLFEYCQQNNRVCPMPQKWNDLYNLLNNKKQKSSGGWAPPLPFILATWHDTPALMKILRLREHIEWAEKEGQLEQINQFLTSLEEKDWYHLQK